MGRGQPGGGGGRRLGGSPGLRRQLCVTRLDMRSPGPGRRRETRSLAATRGETPDLDRFFSGGPRRRGLAGDRLALDGGAGLSGGSRPGRRMFLGGERDGSDGGDGKVFDLLRRGGRLGKAPPSPSGPGLGGPAGLPGSEEIATYFVLGPDPSIPLLDPALAPRGSLATLLAPPLRRQSGPPGGEPDRGGGAMGPSDLPGPRPPLPLLMFSSSLLWPSSLLGSGGPPVELPMGTGVDRIPLGLSKPLLDMHT